jgi:hypothetical protein
MQKEYFFLPCRGSALQEPAVFGTPECAKNFFKRKFKNVQVHIKLHLKLKLKLFIELDMIKCAPQRVHGA